MASNATVGILKAMLTADASQFKTEMRSAAQAPKAVQDSVTGLGKEVQRLTPQAERMVKAFQGDKLLNQAKNIVTAVNQIGGAARLTDAHAARVNKTLTDAIAQSAALGREAPKGWLALAAATDRVAQSATKAGTALKAIPDRRIDIARGAGQAQTDISRLASRFSGREQIAEANKLAAAIGLVGGATKLTKSEQASANGIVNEAIAKYKALGQTAPKSLIDLEKATNGAGERQSWLTSKTIAFGAAAGAFIGNVAFNAVTKLGQAFLDTAAKGAKFVAVSQSFDRLTASIGQSGSAMLAVSRGATKGLIADLDLMLSTNKAILLGLPVTTREMGTLAKTAITLGRAMGLDATTALDNLITALGRSSPLILDNLGLTVKVGEANEAYARSLGKSASALTEAEQKTAFYNAAMAAAQKKTDELGDVQLTLTDQLGRLSTATGNIITKWAAGANQAGSFTSAISFLADEAVRVADNMDLAAQAIERLKSGTQISSAPTATDRMADFTRRLFGGILPGGLADVILSRPEFQSPAVRREIEKILQETQARILKELDAGLGKPVPFDTGTQIDTGGARNPFAIDDLLVKQTDELAKKLEEAAKAAQALRDHWLSNEDKTKALDAAKTIGSVANISKLTTERQRELAQALLAGVAAWRANGEAIPPFITKMLGAALSTKTMVDELRALEQVSGDFSFPDFGAQDSTDRDFARAAAILESIGRRTDAEREAARVSRSIEFDRAQFAIEQAERWGASLQTIYGMESQLSKRRLDAAIADADEEFREKTRLMDRSVPEIDSEYRALEVLHKRRVDQMIEDFRQGEIRRRDEIRRSMSFWRTELGQIISGGARGLARQASSGLFSLFTGVGSSNQEAKKAAREAREDYERLAKSGKASAEAITRAYRDMREKEEAANITFGHRFKEWLGGLGQTFTDWINDMVGAWMRDFIGGLMKALARSKLGQAITNWVGKLIPGVGTGGMLQNTGASLVPHLIGLGGAAAAAPMVGGVSAALPAAIASQGVSATVAGSAAAGAGAGGGAAAGGGSFFLSNPAFWANPWTIAGMGAFALGLAVWKKGLFRGGEEALVVNPKRDTFVQERGGITAIGENLIKVFQRQGMTWAQAEERRSLLIDKMLLSADTEQEFDNAAKTIDDAMKGNTSVLRRIEDLLRRQQNSAPGTWARMRADAAILGNDDWRFSRGWRGLAGNANVGMSSRSTTTTISASDSGNQSRGWRSFHTGGMVGRSSIVPPTLKSGEVLAKLLVGESVLTKRATDLVGGPFVNRLNALSFAPPSIPSFMPALATAGAMPARQVPPSVGDMREVHLHVHNAITAWDGKSVREAVQSREFADTLANVIERNKHHLGARVSRVVLTK